MPKNILIFSDGTGQIGGIHPDQRLSNVYKMYRAMRPSPDSPIKPSEQFAFYDPGLGAGEISGGTFRRVRNMLEAAVGTGIDENVIDCYEAIIANYEHGDKICVFGFSRGAYTARAVTNVLNLCGVPTKNSDGSPVPRHGPKLRKIASDAVKYVYNHGAGSRRSKFENEREEKARRFRTKYGSNALGKKAHEQGNIQPTFVGVFDTVAALGSLKANILVYGVLIVLFALISTSIFLNWSVFISTALVIVVIGVLYWFLVALKNQFKYFSPNPKRPLRFSNPFDWLAIVKNSHWAVWNQKNYDKYLDSDVQFARHALAIDEQRADFPRVKWGSLKEAKKTEGRNPEWMKQVWFPGCHSDIGGSYPEVESRLSDIALKWMLEELKECVPDIHVVDNRLVASPDPFALQHEEEFIFSIGPFRKKWRKKPRVVKVGTLHSSVFDRLKAITVPQMGEVKEYRPEALSKNTDTIKYYKNNDNGVEGACD